MSDSMFLGAKLTQEAATLTEWFGKLPAGSQRDGLQKAMDETDQVDLVTYQQVQARAHASGRIKLEVAQWLYQKIGGEAPSVEKWKALPIGERLVVSKMMLELMQLERGGRRLSA